MLLTLFVTKGRNESPIFDLYFAIAVAGMLAIFVLWDRRYRPKWHPFRARNWLQAEGQFLPGSGELVTMRKGRSRDIAGFEVWLDYGYQSGDKLEGTNRRFFRTKSEAQALIARLEGQRILVTYRPENPLYPSSWTRISIS
jgi:hypothetical protein